MSILSIFIFFQIELLKNEDLFLMSNIYSKWLNSKISFLIILALFSVKDVFKTSFVIEKE